MARKRAILLILAAGAATVGACADDSKRKANAELTADESAALLTDIRDHHAKATELTPREKQAVMRTLNGGNAQSK